MKALLLTECQKEVKALILVACHGELKAAIVTDCHGKQKQLHLAKCNREMKTLQVPISAIRAERHAVTGYHRLTKHDRKNPNVHTRICLFSSFCDSLIHAVISRN